MPKVYPLEIENVGEDTYTLMSRGHHDPHEFMRQVRADGYEWPLGMPTHRWVRTVPTRDPAYTCKYVFAKTGGRGVWPATYANEAYGDEQYEIVAAACKDKASHV